MNKKIRLRKLLTFILISVIFGTSIRVVEIKASDIKQEPEVTEQTEIKNEDNIGAEIEKEEENNQEWQENQQQENQQQENQQKQEVKDANQQSDVQDHQEQQALENRSSAEISYNTHVQTYGWMDEVKNGETSGTIGKYKRIEAIKIGINSDIEGSVEYRSYIEGNGWSDISSNRQESGTTGSAKRLEAIRINLTGQLAEKYDIYYRVHCQSYGWLGWAVNGEVSGTIGYDKRLEAIEILLVEKGGEKPGETENCNKIKNNVLYNTHVQTYGWMNDVKDGDTAGTIGQKKRIESIKIHVNSEMQGGIEYSSYVEGKGWTDKTSNGSESGTVGEKRRLEAIKINLTGELADAYDIYYRVHCQYYGWLDWAMNGTIAGTIECDKRMEAIEIKLVKKGDEAPGKTDSPNVIKDSVKYTTHVQSYGWLDEVKNGEMSGTTEKAKRIEAVKIFVSNSIEGGIEYSTYVQGKGWTGSASNGEICGTEGESRRVEAIKINLTGPLADVYDVYYRTYCQTFGWLDWTNNGSTAGTLGYGKRMEAIEIRLIKKGEQTPGNIENPSKVKESIEYNAYIQASGWSERVNEGVTSGLPGQGKIIESLKLSPVMKEQNEYISYRPYVQSYGWKDWVTGGNEAGTPDSGKRIEAFEIKLNGEWAEKFDVYYRAYIESAGWLDWAKNGETAGSMGYSKRMEAYQVRLVKKGGSAPGSTAVPQYSVVDVNYKLYQANVGWLPEASNGSTAGNEDTLSTTSGISLKVSDDFYDGGVKYRAYMQSNRWQSWKYDGQLAGVTDQVKRMEAIQVELTDELAEVYNIYYRAYVEGNGWLGWAKNGETAGSTDLYKRINAVQVCIVPKKFAAPGSTSIPYLSSQYLGIDVSAWQGRILWNSVKTAGIDFAMLRVVEGKMGNLKEDSTFAYNYLNAAANGIKVGVYRYGYAMTTAQAKKEAEKVLESIKGKAIAYPVVYDVEDAATQGTLPKSQLTAIIKEFKKTIEAAGYKFMIYANVNWLKNKIDMNEFAEDEVWVASWKSNISSGHGYTGKGKVIMWQYSSQGKVTGIAGNVDMNISYKAY